MISMLRRRESSSTEILSILACYGWPCAADGSVSAGTNEDEAGVGPETGP